MRRWLTSWCAVLLSWVRICGVVGAISTAASLPANNRSHAETHPNDPVFRRVFVPADAPETWPVGNERYLPISNTQFQRLVEASPDQPLGEQPLVLQSSHAVHKVEYLTNNTLKGTSTWLVELLGEEPRLLSIDPLSFAVQSASWLRSPQKEISLGLWGRVGATPQHAVLVEQTDELMLKWVHKATAIESDYADFVLQQPIIVPQELELQLPAKHTATLSSAQLVDTEADALGGTRLRFRLGAYDTHRLRVHRPTSRLDDRDLPLVSQTNSYELRPSRLAVDTELRLDARTQKINELIAELDPGLRVIEVSIDREPVDWRIAKGSESSTLVIACAHSDQPQSVRVRCLANTRPNTAWTLPKLRFNKVSWTEGSTSLLVSPELELRSLSPRQATMQHIVGISAEAQQGEVYRLQEWHEDAGLEIEFGRVPTRLHVESVTTYELGRGSSQAILVSSLSSVGGAIHQFQANLAKGWTVDAVSSTPENALQQWHVDQRGGSSQLRFQLNQPISPQKPLLLKIIAREITGRKLLPATVQDLKLTRFQQADTVRQLLGFRSELSKQLLLPNSLERSQLRLDKIQEYELSRIEEYVASLLVEPSRHVLIDTELCDLTERIEFRQEPSRYTADIHTEVVAFPDSLKHQYQLDIQVQSGSVSELQLLADTRLPDDIQWNLREHRGLVTMQQLTTSVQGAASPSSSKYLLRLPAAMNGDFSLNASYDRPAQSIEKCTLVRLPQATDWQGQVVLRGSLNGFRVLDHGWTPTMTTLHKFGRSNLPELGTYRLGAEERRRRGTESGLRLLRRSSAPSAPQLFAWLAEYHTLQAANGAAIHTASYYIENLGVSDAQVTLPAGAKLQEAWINDQQLEQKQITLDGNSCRFRFDENERWHSLALKFSTIQSPLGGSATLQPALPDCSFPVNLNRWTLWAPEQFEIENTRPLVSSQRNYGWHRVFGPLSRSRGETVFNPVSASDWVQLWSAPVVERKTKSSAEKLAYQFSADLDHELDRPVADILN